LGKLFGSTIEPTECAHGGVILRLQLVRCVDEWITLTGRVGMLRLHLIDVSLFLIQVYDPKPSSQYKGLLEETRYAMRNVG